MAAGEALFSSSRLQKPLILRFRLFMMFSGGWREKFRKIAMLWACERTRNTYIFEPQIFASLFRWSAPPVLLGQERPRFELSRIRNAAIRAFYPNMSTSVWWTAHASAGTIFGSSRPMFLFPMNDCSDEMSMVCAQYRSSHPIIAVYSTYVVELHEWMTSVVAIHYPWLLTAFCYSRL